MKTLDEVLKTEYPVEVHKIDEGDGEFYYFAFLPDFGYAACAATGDTKEEAIAELNLLKRDVIQHFYETGKNIPEPSKAPFETAALQQMPLRVTKSLHRKLQQNAKDSELSLNAYISQVLTEHVTITAVETAAERILGKAIEETLVSYFEHLIETAKAMNFGVHYDQTNPCLSELVKLEKDENT
jgi:predicted HicB family RNase H-like nuclease